MLFSCASYVKRRIKHLGFVSSFYIVDRKLFLHVRVLLDRNILMGKYLHYWKYLFYTICKRYVCCF